MSGCVVYVFSCVFVDDFWLVYFVNVGCYCCVVVFCVFVVSVCVFVGVFFVVCLVVDCVNGVVFIYCLLGWRG